MDSKLWQTSSDSRLQLRLCPSEFQGLTEEESFRTQRDKTAIVSQEAVPVLRLSGTARLTSACNRFEITANRICCSQMMTLILVWYIVPAPLFDLLNCWPITNSQPAGRPVQKDGTKNLPQQRSIIWRVLRELIQRLHC
jgi:hypothetical protein